MEKSELGREKCEAPRQEEIERSKEIAKALKKIMEKVK